MTNSLRLGCKGEDARVNGWRLFGERFGFLISRLDERCLHLRACTGHSPIRCYVPTKTNGRFPLNLFEIPFTPDAAHSWTIPIPGDGEKHFASRAEALEFAMSLAKGVRIANGQSSYLCVEGADGRWRLFTPDLLPVKEEG